MNPIPIYWKFKSAYWYLTSTQNREAISFEIRLCLQRFSDMKPFSDVNRGNVSKTDIAWFCKVISSCFTEGVILSPLRIEIAACLLPSVPEGKLFNIINKSMILPPLPMVWSHHSHRPLSNRETLKRHFLSSELNRLGKAYLRPSCKTFTFVKPCFKSQSLRLISSTSLNSTYSINQIF